MAWPSPGLGAEELVRLYRPVATAHDELCAPGDPPNVRTHWKPFFAELDRLSPAQLAERWEQARDLLHENGVSYNVHGDPQGTDRPWPLSPLPVLLPSQEWQDLVAGLIQRARLIELVLEDLHGPQRLLREGLVPPALLFRHPGFLRACQGIAAPDGRWLPFYAVDLLRAPDGRFRVLSDRTQVPTGAGYALENRIVVSRALPEAFAACHVERLAPFFRTMRDTLARLAPRNKDNPRIAVLTLGPSDPTYFEQAYLAQYLGYPLVHGGDLTVREARVYLKTLGGLHPVDVLLRRIEDALCDPLELRPDALIGVPGLVQAVRERTVAVANPLGSGVAAAPAFMALLPAICRHLLGQDLRLGSVETLWCGDASSRQRVLEQLPRYVLKPAFNVSQTQPIFARALDARALQDLRARIEATPADWVAQEQVDLATTPALTPGGMEPRPWVLRTFLVASGEAHTVMPGGLSRFAPTTEALEVSIQRGGGSKDTWVTSAAPVPTFSLLPPPSAKVPLSRGGHDLPSRVADNLFWLGRYAERAESQARLARVITLRATEQRDGGPAPEVTALLRALLAAAHMPKARVTGLAPTLALALDDPEEIGSLRSTLRSLQRVSRECRDRISGDSWRVVIGVEDALDDAGDARLAKLNAVVLRLSALSGIIADSMTRGQAWRFLDLGRRIERAFQLVTLLQSTLTSGADREAPLLEAVLEAADSGMTYRRRYLNRLEVAPVLDLLLTDDTNPRAVLFQVNTLAEHVAALPRDRAVVRTAEERLVLQLQHDLQLADLDELATVEDHKRPALAALLDQAMATLPALSDALSASYLSHAVVSRQLGGRPFPGRGP